MVVRCWLCKGKSWIVRPSRRPERSPLLVLAGQHTTSTQTTCEHRFPFSGGLEVWQPADWGPTTA